MPERGRLKDVVTIAAVEQKELWLMHGLAVTGMASFVLWKMAAAEYGRVPLLAMVVILCILSGFLLFLAVGLSMLALAVGKIVVNREEVKMCLGPLVLKRIPTREIHIVSLAHVSFGKGNRTIEVPMMVLSTEDPEQLTQRGKRIIQRRGRWQQQSGSMGVASDSRKTCVCAALSEALVSYLLTRQKGLLMSFSIHRAEFLRRYIRGAEFLV